MIKEILILFTIVVCFILSGCGQGGTDLTIENNESAISKNTNHTIDRERNMPDLEIDAVLQSLADKILENVDIIGDPGDDEKQSMVRGMPVQIFNMINQAGGLSLISGISISSRDINIIIVESSAAEKDTELLKDPENSGTLFQARPDANSVSLPDGGDLPPRGDVPPGVDRYSGDVNSSRDENSPREDGAWQRRGGWNMFGNIEDSEIKVVGKYIIITDTHNNSKLFEICTNYLSEK